MGNNFSIPAAALAVFSLLPVARASDTWPIFESALIQHDEAMTEPIERQGLRVMDEGQTVETTVDLPPLPENLRGQQRIVANIRIEPVVIEEGGQLRPGDPWPRAGNLSVVQNEAGEENPELIELVRFVTGFGGKSEISQDITALAPLINRRTTFRVNVSTWAERGWRVTVMFTYSQEDVGYRRPRFAKSVFNDPEVTAKSRRLKGVITVPAGLTQVRLRILSTGHATDGEGGDEFITRHHILKLDGRIVSQWRPWSEIGGTLRESNPASGRVTIDGRELWSSDIDRSGWSPGAVVEPMVIPLPELTPGKHTIEIEVMGIRPQRPGEEEYGYWRISAIALGDEPWPEGQ